MCSLSGLSHPRYPGILSCVYTIHITFNTYTFIYATIGGQSHHDISFSAGTPETLRSIACITSLKLLVWERLFCSLGCAGEFCLAFSNANYRFFYNGDGDFISS